MTNGENKVTIGFNFENEFGDKFSAITSIGVLDGSHYRADIDLIGEQLNVFLRQCGYARQNDFIFMEDVNEEEYEALADCLSELRLSKAKGGDESCLRD